MHRLQAKQKNIISELRNCVGKKAPDQVLIDLCTKNNWDSNQALNAYFEQGLSEKYAEASIDKKNVQTLFGKYSTDGKKIEGESIEKLFTDLSVPMEDPVTLLISFYMNAQQ